LESANEVLKTIDKKRTEIIDLLRELVTVPSVDESGPPEKQIQRVVANALKKIGCSVDVWEPDLNILKKHPAYVPIRKHFKGRPTVVGVLRGLGGGRSIVLNGHVDVVTPEPLARWKYDPWGGEIHQGRMYGRGASDMKGGVASMIAAVECLVEANIQLKGDVILESVLAEESGGDGTLACLLRGYRGDAGIVTEPTGLELQPAHRGGRFFKISIQGKAAHAGVRYEGINAIELAMKIYNSLTRLEEARRISRKHALFDRYPIQVPLSVGIMKSGEWPSTVPDKATLEGTIECLPNEDIIEVSKDLEACVQQTAQDDKWMMLNRPIVEWPGLWSESSEIPSDHPIVKTVEESFKFAIGMKPVVSGFPAGCDARILTRYSETPSLIFGPGSLEQAHAADEFIQVDEVITSTKVIALSVLEWCST